MPNYPDVGVSVKAEIDDYNRKMADVIGTASQVEAKVGDINSTVDVKVTTEDSEVDSTLRKVGDLDSGTADVKVNIDDSEVDETQDKLDTLIKLQVIDLAINVTGTTLGFVDTLVNLPGVGALFEMDTALAQLQGRTGAMIPQAEELINDLYVNGWGESRTQIAEVIAEAHNLEIANEDLEEATFAAFNVAAVTGGETNEILRAMDSLVKNGLVNSYNEAADVIVTGFQTGNDRGQDLLDTLNEYGSTFAELEISGPGALALINSGLDAGVDNSDRIADAIRETGIRLREMHTNPDIQAAFDDLDSLSDVDLQVQFDAFQAGEISGDQFFESFFTAVEDAMAADPERAAAIITTLIGTISEDFGPEAISQLTTVWDEDVMGAMEGRAEEGGTAMSNSLQSKIDQFFRWAELEAANFLSSDAIDLDTKIEDIKNGLTEAVNILAAGGTLGEAIEVGLNIPGFQDSVTRFESGVGNFLISVLELVAGIQELTGNADAAASTREEIARLAAQQLAFDLQVANPEDVANVIATALDRGVDESVIQEVFDETITGLIDEGEIGKARELLDTLDELPGAIITVTNSFTGLSTSVELPRIDGEAYTDYLARLQEYADSLSVPGTEITVEMPGVDTGALELEVQEAAAAAEAAWIEAINAGDFELAASIAEGLGDPALIADTFRAAIQGQDWGVAEAIAEDMSDNPEFLQQAFDQAFSAGQAGLALDIAEDLGDEELIAQAQSLADSYKAAFDTAMAEGDVDTAARLAEMLDDDSLRAKVEELKTEIENAANAVEEEATAMADAVDLADQRTATALTGNTVTASFEAVKVSAETNFPPVIAWFDRFAAAAEMADNKVNFRNSISQFGALNHQIGAFDLGKMNAIINAANGFAGATAVINQAGDTTNNINVTNNNTNGAQVAASTYDVGAMLS